MGLKPRVLRPEVRLTTYPHDDSAFEVLAGTLLAGTRTPAQLEAGLRHDYPLVRVVYGITEGMVRRWYAYRDGRFIPARS
jgi:hypothetical protein